MNVAPNDLAMLVHPLFPENQDKICTVVSRLENIGCRVGDDVWWLCTFPTPVKTEGFGQYGLINFATIQDWRLRRIAGPNVPMAEEDSADVHNEAVELAA